MLSSVANQCLSYDSAILPPELCAPLGAALDRTTLETAETILGPLGPDAKVQLRMGRELGGCDLRSAEVGCFTRFLSTALRLQDVALHGAAAAETAAACDTCAAALATRGVFVDERGMGRTAAARPLDVRSLPGALPRRMRSWHDALDAAAAARLGKPARERLAACGGPEGGAYLYATRSELRYTLTDTEFASYTRLRLGLPVVAPGPCQLTRVARSGEHAVCGAMMDASGSHCISCKVGGAVLAAHSR